MIIYSSVRNAGVAQLVEQLICNQQVGEYLLILADFYFPMGFVNGINAVSPTVANKKE